MGSKGKARSRAARRSRDLDSPISRQVEEDLMVGRDYSSDISVQSEKDQRKLIEAPAYPSVHKFFSSNHSPQKGVESEILATYTGEMPVTDYTGFLPVTCNTLSQHNSGDVPVTCKGSFTPVSFTDVIQIPFSHTRAPSTITNAYKGNTSVHSPFSHEVGDRPPLYLPSAQGPVGSPFMDLSNALPENL